MHGELRKDYYAGALVAIIGVGALLEGLQDNIGSLKQIGSGFFPAALGTLMILVGVLIAGTASGAALPEVVITLLPNDGQKIANSPDWRGWTAIIGGVLMFILLAESVGLLPATFVCVFVAASGDRESKWWQSLILATGVTIFGILLFAFGLKVQLPIIHGFPS